MDDFNLALSMDRVESCIEPESLAVSVPTLSG